MSEQLTSRTVFHLREAEVRMRKMLDALGSADALRQLADHYERHGAEVSIAETWMIQDVFGGSSGLTAFDAADLDADEL